MPDIIRYVNLTGYRLISNPDSPLAERAEQYVPAPEMETVSNWNYSVSVVYGIGQKQYNPILE
jgi:hypothetical protein